MTVAKALEKGIIDFAGNVLNELGKIISSLAKDILKKIIQQAMGTLDLAQGRLSLTNSGSKGFTKTFEGVNEYRSMDLKVSGSGSITFNFEYEAELSLTVNFDAKIVFKGFDNPFYVERVAFSVGGSIDVSVTTELEFEGEVGFEYEPDELQKEMSDPKMFTIGFIPVVIQPKLSFSITGSINAQFGYTIDFDYNVGYTAGVEYTSANGFNPVSDLDQTPPTIDISQNINSDADGACAIITATLGTEIKFAVELYGIVVPYVSATPSIEVQISTPADPQNCNSNIENICTDNDHPTAILFEPSLSLSANAGIEFSDEFADIADLLFSSVDLPELEINIFEIPIPGISNFWICDAEGVIPVPFPSCCGTNDELTASPTSPSQAPSQAPSRSAILNNGNVYYYIQSDIVGKNELKIGDSLNSLNDEYRLEVKSSGNKRLRLIKTDTNGNELSEEWKPSHTIAGAGSDVYLQIYANGILWLRESTGSNTNNLWYSTTAKGSEYGPYQLLVSNDGYAYIVNSRNERIWSSDSTHTPSPTMKYVDADLLPMKCSIDNDYKGNWDGNVNIRKSGTFFNGIVSSVHDNDKEDRRFKWRYCKPNGMANFANNDKEDLPPTEYDDTWFRKCNQILSNAAIYGIQTSHNNHHEDRIWTVGCAKLNTQLYKLDNCNWMNNDNAINDYDEIIGNVYCPNNGVIQRIWSQHNNHKEDRKFKFMCCNVYDELPNSITNGVITMQYALDQQLITVSKAIAMNINSYSWPITPHSGNIYDYISINDNMIYTLNIRVNSLPIEGTGFFDIFSVGTDAQFVVKINSNGFRVGYQSITNGWRKKSLIRPTNVDLVINHDYVLKIELSQSLGILQSMKCSSDGWYIGDWDGDVDNKKAGKFYNGIVKSKHDNGKEDRRFWWRYCGPDGMPNFASGDLSDLLITSNDVTWSKTCEQINSGNAAIYGIESTHNNHHEDRRWTIGCAIGFKFL
eukprot:522408_1